MSGDHAHGSAVGVPGDAKKPARVVQVVMREDDGRMVFVPDRIVAKRGEQIRFVLVNNGELDHEFVLGSTAEISAHAEAMKTMPDMAHDEPNSRAVKQKERAGLLWRFASAGEFVFACLIPGHLEAGMKGTIIVK